ncbi:hypothetical protein NQ314_017497 [Rhamnusium bicolor]|uniref:DDE Tnp4 domain-containing protein n=1 Tax=Rhamnusium bicolor TaxID=1586634 RepID=A0AAV8WU93_9CUCU|nr:hypothetical protein NQ314_017497 [Rhamnusium bicolor]
MLFVKIIFLRMTILHMRKQVEKENIAPEIQSEDMENVFYDQDDLNIEMDIFVVEECMGKSFQDASVQTEIQCAVEYNSNQTQTANGTEIPINKPALPLAQQATFSQYKNKNTVKPVIGMTPGGLVSFITPTYGGSASDRQIIDRSNLASKCDLEIL